MTDPSSPPSTREPSQGFEETHVLNSTPSHTSLITQNMQAQEVEKTLDPYPTIMSDASIVENVTMELEINSPPKAT